MALLWWLVGNAIEKFGEHFVQTRLMHDADNLLSALHVDPEGVLQITPGRMATIYQQPFSGHYFALLIGERVVYSRSLWDETLAVSPLAQGKTLQWRVAGPSGQPLLVWAGGFQKQGQQLVIAVAEDLTPLQASLVRFNWYFAGLSLLALMLLLGVQHYIVSRAFKSLEKIRQEGKTLLL